MKRTKLCDRTLPHYSRGEEVMNMVTHIVGGGIGIIALVVCLLRTLNSGSMAGIVTSVIYGCSMIAVYAVSSVYHGLSAGTAKKVMQIVDHCTIYLLIAGTYTPIVVCAMAPVYPAIGWGLFIGEWGLALIAAVLTAIDLKRFKIFSMFCYISMGWGIIFFLPQALEVMGTAGFGFLLSGGIAYTIGAVLFGLGCKLKWMHSVFHIFVVAGSLLQLISIVFYVF